MGGAHLARQPDDGDDPQVVPVGLRAGRLFDAGDHEPDGVEVDGEQHRGPGTGEWLVGLQHDRPLPPVLRPDAERRSPGSQHFEPLRRAHLVVVAEVDVRQRRGVQRRLAAGLRDGLGGHGANRTVRQRDRRRAAGDVTERADVFELDRLHFRRRLRERVGDPCRQRQPQQAVEHRGARPLSDGACRGGGAARVLRDLERLLAGGRQTRRQFPGELAQRRTRADGDRAEQPGGEERKRKRVRSRIAEAGEQCVHHRTCISRGTANWRARLAL